MLTVCLLSLSSNSSVCGRPHVYRRRVFEHQRGRSHQLVASRSRLPQQHSLLAPSERRLNSSRSRHVQQRVRTTSSITHTFNITPPILLRHKRFFSL